MFAAYLRQDLRFFDRSENTIGALTSRLDSDAQSLFELMGFNISMIILSLITVVICAILSIAVSWKLGLVGVFAGIPPMILGGYIRIRTETKMDLDIDARFSKSASIASESIIAIRTVSSLAIEEDVLRRYTNELDLAIHESRLSLVSLMLFFSFTQSVEFFVLALGFWYAGIAPRVYEPHVLTSIQVGLQAHHCRGHRLISVRRLLSECLFLRSELRYNVHLREQCVEPSQP